MIPSCALNFCTPPSTTRSLDTDTMERMRKAFPANKTGGVSTLTGLAYVSNLQTRKVIAEGEEREINGPWCAAKTSSSALVGQQQTGSSSPICKAMWCQVYNPLMPDLTAGGRENRLEVRPDLGGSPICYPALPQRGTN